MLCQLSYRGLTTTRLRTLAATSAYVVFRSYLLHSLINSGPQASCLPVQPVRECAVPSDSTGAAKITSGSDDDAALSHQRDELFNGDRCHNPLPEQLGHPSRLDQLERAAARWLAGGSMTRPGQLAKLSVPGAPLDLVPADVPPSLLIPVRQGRRAGDAEPRRGRRPCEDACGSAGFGRARGP